MRRASHLLGRALRETGQATDRLGLTISNAESFKETFSRHRQVMNLYDKVCIYYLYIIIIIIILLLLNIYLFIYYYL
jgi:hypothetical protein